jgi:two-component system NtrC family sensor kinase
VELTTTLLEELGYGVRRVANVRDALDLLERQRFDLVLSDIVMPGGVSGLELARSIRRHHPALPVLLTTGYSTVASDAVQEGFSILPKPYTPEALARRIDDALKQAREVAES